MSVSWAGEYSSKDEDFSFADNTPVGRAEVMAELCKFWWSLGKLFYSWVALITFPVIEICW